MASFPKLSVLASLESSIEAATHLEPKHAAVVGAARALAAKIDAWDVLVQWALEDAFESEARPKVPANDNTSLGTYSRYLEQLALTVPVAKVGPIPARPAEPEPSPAEPEPSPAVGGGTSISSLQDRVAQRKAR